MEARFRKVRNPDGGFELPSHNNESHSRRSGGYRSLKETPRPLSLVIVLIFICLSFSFVKYINLKLPKPLTTDDVSDNPSSFIEERARNDLINLSGLGPRVCGSHANDVAAVDAILRILQDIQRTKFAVHKLEFEVEKPSGAFYMGFQDGLTSSYASVPNIMAKLESAKGGDQSGGSILVNCHFDSVPGSPGASDNMISCTVMLEVLRVLSRQPKPLKNSVVFLFNGAEENGMQAAHGFVAGRVGNSSEVGHRWSKNIKTFINLEAAGAGGREILFQTGPGNGWLLKTYSKVPYPYGSAVGEEIFQKGLIPSDTDYRIFRDFSKLPGLDMAFINNGFVYHTKFDRVEAVTPGSIQHEGSNVLALVQDLGSLDFTKIEYTNEKMVFFDLFGFLMVTYSERVATLLNVVVAIVVIIIAWKEANGDHRLILWHVLSTFGAWTSGILSAAVVAILLNIFKFYSPFHSYPWFVFLLFGIPCMVGQVVAFTYALKGSEDNTWIATKTTLALLLLAFTFTSRMVFVIMINLAFGIVGWYAARQLFRQSDSQKRLLFYLLVGEAFPFTLSLYLVTGCIDVFVPIMGRSGSETNPNVFVAVLTAFTMSIPCFSGLVPIFVFFKKTFFRGSALLMIVVLATMVVFIGKIPYGEKTPMRLHILEVDRTFYDKDLTTVKKNDAGFWFFNLDPNIPNYYSLFSENVPEVDRREEVDVFACDELYCGLPFYFPVRKLIRKTQWVPKKTGLSPELKGRVRMDVTQDTFISPSVRRITFSFIGPDHMTINISPGSNFDIIKWSLTPEVSPPTEVLWKGRPTYFIFHGRGIEFQRLELTIDFQKKEAKDESQNSDLLVDITQAAFYLFGDDMKSQNMKELVRRFPPWTYALGWSAVSNVYSIS